MIQRRLQIKLQTRYLCPLKSTYLKVLNKKEDHKETLYKEIEVIAIIQVQMQEGGADLIRWEDLSQMIMRRELSSTHAKLLSSSYCPWRMVVSTLMILQINLIWWNTWMRLVIEGEVRIQSHFLNLWERDQQTQETVAIQRTKRPYWLLKRKMGRKLVKNPIQ